MPKGIKRWYIKYLVWKDKKRSSKYKYPPNDERRKAVRIAKRLIADPNSKLECSAETLSRGPRYIIQNGHMDVKITDSKIRIINGTYKYDVSFVQDDPNMESVIKAFADEMEKRLDEHEEAINLRVGKSLDDILNEILHRQNKTEDTSDKIEKED